MSEILSPAEMLADRRRMIRETARQLESPKDRIEYLEGLVARKEIESESDLRAALAASQKEIGELQACVDSLRHMVRVLGRIGTDYTTTERMALEQADTILRLTMERDDLRECLEKLEEFEVRVARRVADQVVRDLGQR